MTTELGTKPHPAAHDALRYVTSLPRTELMMWLESFSSCAIEGNELADHCAATLNRVLKGEAVGDRYILGLAWTIRSRKWDEANSLVKKGKKDRK